MARMMSRVASAVGPLPASRETQPMPIAAECSDGVLRFAGAEDLLWPDGDRSRVNVLSDLVVQEVLHDGSRATGILARRRGCPQDPPVVVHAEATVVAAGTFGSAQIFEASRVDAGPALGRYLMDHPSVISRVPLRADILRDVPLDDPTFTVWVPYSPDHPWQQIVQRTVPHLSPHPVGVEPRETADIVTFHPTEAREDNRLIFDRTATDPFGLPTARAAWALSEADRRAVARGLAEHGHIAAEIGDLSRGWVPSLSKVGASTHLMGSCGMGLTDDGTSVVNAEGRLWRYENLYVAGNAVLSTPNAANPTLTTVAAALHCAEAIVRDSACPAQ
jgi:choline dehydrogenase-like flavoprotein